MTYVQSFAVDERVPSFVRANFATRLRQIGKKYGGHLVVPPGWDPSLEPFVASHVRGTDVIGLAIPDVVASGETPALLDGLMLDSVYALADLAVQEGALFRLPSVYAGHLHYKEPAIAGGCSDPTGASCDLVDAWWQDPLTTEKLGGGDCKSLVARRLVELWSQGVKARPYIEHFKGPSSRTDAGQDRYHVLIEKIIAGPAGFGSTTVKEDPSIALGMRVDGSQPVAAGPYPPRDCCESCRHGHACEGEAA